MHMYAPQTRSFLPIPIDLPTPALANPIDHLQKSAWQLQTLPQDCMHMAPLWQRFFLGNKLAREFGLTAIYSNLRWEYCFFGDDIQGIIRVQLAGLANIASNYLIAGQEASRHGTAHPSIVPYQVFSCKDGFLMIGAGNDKQVISRDYANCLKHWSSFW